MQLARNLWLDWRILLWIPGAALIGLNAYLWPDLVQWVLTSPTTGFDFWLFETAVSSTNPYAGVSYVWSPLALPLLAAVIPFGYAWWTALHFASLLFLRDWRLISLVLLSYPFWHDVGVGNVMTFVMVAGFGAARGSRVATGIFLVLTLLMPRPLMIPVTASVLWRQPQWRVPFAAVFVLHAVGVLATGYADEWLNALQGSSVQLVSEWNWSPSRWIGEAWLPVGIALAGWLTWRGWLGLASLAIQPYLFPQYLLMATVDARKAFSAGSSGYAESYARGTGGQKD